MRYMAITKVLPGISFQFRITEPRARQKSVAKRLKGRRG